MPANKKQLAIKVDVDTYEGLQKGVPRLLSIFQDFHIKATFFVSMGPDNSGKAIRRIFTKKGFLKKMLRTKAVKTYGLKTIMYGTLLPAPQIARSYPEILQEIKKQGHELGIHGYDHVKWHDLLDKLSYEQIKAEEFDPAVKTYQEILKEAPKSSACPGWKVNTKSLKLQDESTMIYHSDSRGEYPFFPLMDGQQFNHLQIPSTLPTLDEILGEEDVVPLIVNQISKSYKSLEVFTIHAEVEGMNYQEIFIEILNELKDQNIEYLPLIDVAQNLLKDKEKIPACQIINKEIKGRAGAVGVQVTT